jgi:hypothetical protein
MRFDQWKGNWFVEKQTVERIETDNLYPDDGRVPHVPFGFNHQRWADFKARMQPDDELYFFNSPAESWRNLAGRTGYVLVRDGEVADELVTMMN